MVIGQGDVLLRSLWPRLRVLLEPEKILANSAVPTAIEHIHGSSAFKA